MREFKAGGRVVGLCASLAVLLVSGPAFAEKCTPGDPLCQGTHRAPKLTPQVRTFPGGRASTPGSSPAGVKCDARATGRDTKRGDPCH
jgi:hypothetical protein